MKFNYKWLLLIPLLLVAIGFGFLIPRLFNDEENEDLSIMQEGGLSAQAEARVQQMLDQIDNYEKLLESSSDDVEILLPLADNYYDLAKLEEENQQINDSYKHYKSAVDYYQHVLQLQPENIAARLSLALSYSGLLMGDVAMREIETLTGSELSALDTTDTDLLIDAGLMYQEDYGRPEEAEILLIKATTQEPENQRAWLSLGFVLSAAGKTTEASAAFEQVIAINPNSDYAQAAEQYLVQQQE